MSTCLRFYEAGVRLEQARLLVTTSFVEIPQPPSVVLTALLRLESVLVQLADGCDGEHALQRAGTILGRCIDDVTGLVVSNDDSYRVCQQTLDTVEAMLSNAVGSTPPPANDLLAWLRLGVLMPRGEGTCPWEVPPGRQPSDEEPRWEWNELSEIQALATQVNTDLDTIFPNITNEHIAWETMVDTPPFFWGWVHIEAGLSALQTEEPNDRLTGVLRDDVTEARDRWIYDHFIAQMVYSEIIGELRQQALIHEWIFISTPQGIRSCLQRYVKRHGLPPLLLRQRGRPGTNN